MGYIYKITNDINDKIYIGKTEFNIEKRFQEHIKDSEKLYKNRPLYNAMNKYGIEHFKIELIEETNNTEEREKYWISYYNSYSNGYNATLGGDGKVLINYDFIVEQFIKGLNIYEISKETGHDVGQISKILKLKGISSEQIKEQGHRKQEKQVFQRNKKTNEITQIFQSVAQAAQWIKNNGYSKDTISGISSHICQCCNNIRKSAYTFNWSYIGD